MPVDTEQRDHILLVTLNRPDKLNALNLEMTDQLTEVWRRFREDDDLWLAIVTGAGDRAFCSGADLGGSGDRPASAGRRPSEEEATALGGYYAWTPVNIWKPVIGAINGYTLAGGLALALSCDLRIASETARIGSMAVKRGRMGGGGATQRLTRYLPFAKGLELLLFGDHVPWPRSWSALGWSTRWCHRMS
ncbi:MAG: enoyl-CoA hydratase/isomerase family protein [Dehalococcoidia bacterium]